MEAAEVLTKHMKGLNMRNDVNVSLEGQVDESRDSIRLPRGEGIYQEGYIGLCADMGLNEIEFSIDELKNGKATGGIKYQTRF